MESAKAHPLEYIFHPKSVAVVGASAGEGPRGWAQRLLAFGYRGQVYPVNPRLTELGGLKAYPTVRDIPGPVDYAIFNIPARLTPQIMADCAAKGVKVAHVFTAGFSEMGTEEGLALERRLATVAREGGVRVIGPNCMGIYDPAEGLTWSPAFSREPGEVSFVSQSGTGASRFVHLANDRAIRFRRVVSYGNAIDLDATDFLEYLAQDEATRVVTCYVEGVRDGRRFISAIKSCLATKPVVVLKAGLTESGAGAAASHTGSLAGSPRVWDAFFKQTGAIYVTTIDEMADVTLALLRMRPPRGRRAGIAGRGGGIGVIATDSCERVGLKVPAFQPETRLQLAHMVPEAGASTRNPVESALGISGATDLYSRGLKVVDADPSVDFIITHLAVDVYGEANSDLEAQVREAAQTLAAVAPTLRKPLAAVLYTGENAAVARAVSSARETLLKAGLPVYPSIETAANAISKVIGYYESATARSA